MVDAGARRATSGFSSLSTARVADGARIARATAFHRRRAVQAIRAVATIPPRVRARSPVATSVASRNCRSPSWAPSRCRTHASSPGSRVECQTSPVTTTVTRMATAVAAGVHDGASELGPGGAGAARRPPFPLRPTMGPTDLHAAPCDLRTGGGAYPDGRSNPSQANLPHARLAQAWPSGRAMASGHGPSPSPGRSSSGSCPTTLKLWSRVTSTWRPSGRRTSTP